jgi:hypothetical protein
MVETIGRGFLILEKNRTEKGGMEMPLKLKVEDDKVVVNNGMPVYVDDEGKDVEVDANRLFSKVNELNAENKTHREKYDGVRPVLDLFDGIEDVTEWKTTADAALETVKKLDDKKLIDAGKVDEVTAAMKIAHEEDKRKQQTSWEKKDEAYQKELRKKDSKIYELMVTAEFGRSPFFTGENPKTNLDPEIAEAYFSKYFKVEENDQGKLHVVGYRDNGKVIYSNKVPGDIAPFTEALEIIIDDHPKKNAILDIGKSGSGSKGGGGGGGGGGEGNDLALLQEQYKTAIEANDAKLAISLKNRIFKIKQAELQAGKM